MTRLHFTFPCAGETLFASLDQGERAIGLLIVSGGSEVRCGPQARHAMLAARIAAQGFAVMRFDRRGVGDSSGLNHGFRSSGPDLEAALRAFRARLPMLRRIVAFGNCDAASALMLQGGAGLDALVLSNPWTFDEGDELALPPPASLRQRYAGKLRSPRELSRLLRGEVDLVRLGKGLRAALAPDPRPSSLLAQMQAGLSRFAGPVRFLLAGRDRTAQAFLAGWDARDPRISLRHDADHSFSAAADQDWLALQLSATLHEQAGQLDMG